MLTGPGNKQQEHGGSSGGCACSILSPVVPQAFCPFCWWVAADLSSAVVLLTAAAVLSAG
jgi:hypothetical protein